MSMLSKATGLLGVGALGAAVAYYLDPDRGEERRSRSLGRLQARSQQAEKEARHVEGRLQGARARAEGYGEAEPVDDHVIKQTIQQRLSGTDVDTQGLSLEVAEGIVRLRGEAPSKHAKNKIEVESMGVPGVREVQSWLHLPGEPAPNKAEARQASGTAS